MDPERAPLPAEIAKLLNRRLISEYLIYDIGMLNPAIKGPWKLEVIRRRARGRPTKSEERLLMIGKMVEEQLEHESKIEEAIKRTAEKMRIGRALAYRGWAAHRLREGHDAHKKSWSE